MRLFRHAGIFQEQQNDHQDKARHEIPARWLKREKLKRQEDSFRDPYSPLSHADPIPPLLRLAFLAFYLDVSFYFLSGHRPTLRYEDLTLTSPCSERLWDARTPESWQQAKSLESKKRTTMKFIDYVDQAMDPDGRARLGYLVEDEFLYGLCAMQAWLHQEFNRNRQWKPVGLPVPSRGALQPMDSAWSAGYWARQLDSWRAKYETHKRAGPILSSRLHAEMMEMSAMPLYHLSQLELRADLKVIAQLSADEQHHSGLYRRQVESKTMEWAATADARWALWYAAQVLKSARERLADIQRDTTTPGTAGPQLGLVALIALYEAGLVAWAYARCVQACDACAMGSSLQAFASPQSSEPLELCAAASSEERRLVQWVQHGGRGAINGSVVCACSQGEILGHYESCLARGSGHWRCGNELAKKLSRLKNRS